MADHADIDHTGLPGVGLTDHDHTGIGDGGDLDAPVIDGYAVFNEESAPGSAATATVRLYAKADGLLYSKDDGGTETLVSGGLGGSISETDLGTTSVGGSSEGRAASTYWAKKVTTANTKPIVGIRAHINGDASHIFGPLAAIYTDNAGAVGDIIAFCGMPAALYGPVASTTYRWLTVPIFFIPAASTDYWIVFGVVINGSTTVNIKYAGSGTDRVITGTTALTDGGWGSSTGNDYSIYAIQMG